MVSKSREIRTTQDVVKNILETDPKARNSDNYLLSVTYATIGKDHGINLENMSVLSFFMKLSEYGFPSPETIRRTRQKLQAEDSSLRASGNVEGARMLNEETFKNYAVKGYV